MTMLHLPTVPTNLRHPVATTSNNDQRPLIKGFHWGKGDGLSSMSPGTTAADVLAIASVEVSARRGAAAAERADAVWIEPRESTLRGSYKSETSSSSWQAREAASSSG